MKKQYIKPETRAIETNTEPAILTTSGAPGFGNGESDELGEYDYWD